MDSRTKFMLMCWKKVADKSRWYKFKIDNIGVSLEKWGYYPNKTDISLIYKFRWKEIEHYSWNHKRIDFFIKNDWQKMVKERKEKYEI